MANTAPPMSTIGVIARRKGVPTHRVEYIVSARRIEPCGWAGNARVFSEQAVERIIAELEGIAAAKLLDDHRQSQVIDGATSASRMQGVTANGKRQEDSGQTV